MPFRCGDCFSCHGYIAPYSDKNNRLHLIDCWVSWYNPPAQSLLMGLAECQPPWGNSWSHVLLLSILISWQSTIVIPIAVTLFCTLFWFKIGLKNEITIYKVHPYWRYSDLLNLLTLSLILSAKCLAKAPATSLGATATPPRVRFILNWQSLATSKKYLNNFKTVPNLFCFSVEKNPFPRFEKFRFFWKTFTKSNLVLSGLFLWILFYGTLSWRGFQILKTVTFLLLGMQVTDYRRWLLPSPFLLSLRLS